MKLLIPIIILISIKQYSVAQYPLFDQANQHEISGCIGELRGGGTRYHYGIDFPASDGTEVYAISTGPLRKLNGANSVGEFGYIHISPTSIINALADGTIISSGTKLGEVYTPNYGDHLHLQKASVNIFGSTATTWEDGGIWINPLIGLTPFIDNQTPTINNVRLFRQGTNDDITSNLTLYGKIDVLFNGEDDGINANGSGNSTYNLAPFQTFFSVDNNNGENLDNHSGINFSNVPPNSSASSIFHSTANQSYWITWITNDPFNSPYNKYWNSRKRNNGSYNNTTDIPTKNKLEGNKIKFHISTCDISNCRGSVLPYNENVFYTVDNFWPYIKEIKIYDVTSIPKLLTVLKRNSFEGTTAENDGYIKNSWLIPAEFVFTGGFSNIKIEVLTSEPMQSMRVKNAIYTIFF